MTACPRTTSLDEADLLRADLPPLYCYPQELNQVFMNLLSNAIHAIGERQGRITITARAVGEEVAVAVADNGCGMAPETVKRIFDPGCQRPHTWSHSVIA